MSGLHLFFLGRGHNIERPFQTYRPSGRFSPTIIFWAIALTATMCLAGWMYQFLMEWVPFLMLKFLIIAGFIVAIMGLTTLFLQFAKCRNRTVAFVIATNAALVALGATHYYLYIWHTDEIAASVEVQADQPGVTGAEIRMQTDFQAYIQIRVESGWIYKDEQKPFAGFWVWLFWAIEAGIFLTAAFLSAYWMAGSPYCENCDTWANFKMLDLQITKVEENTAQQVANAVTLDQVLAIHKSLQSLTEGQLVFEMTCCPKCAKTAHLSVKKEIVKLNEYGKEEKKSQELVSHIVLSPTEVEQVKMLAFRFGGDVASPTIAS